MTNEHSGGALQHPLPLPDADWTGAKAGMKAVPAVSVVDLFCGAGGLSHGFRREGFPIVAGIDSDDHCRIAHSTARRTVDHPNPKAGTDNDSIGT